MSFTAADKLAAIEREIRLRERAYQRWIELRERAYQRWIEQCRMTPGKADHELAVMRAIADDYRTLAAGERLL